MNAQQTATLDTMTTVKGSESQICSNGINSQLPILIDAPLMQIPAHPGDDQPIYRYLPGYSQTNRAGMEPMFVSENEINAPQSVFGPTGVTKYRWLCREQIQKSRTARQVNVCNSQCMPSEMKSEISRCTPYQIQKGRKTSLTGQLYHSDIHSNTKD